MKKRDATSSFNNLMDTPDNQPETAHYTALAFVVPTESKA